MFQIAFKNTDILLTFFDVKINHSTVYIFPRITKATMYSNNVGPAHASRATKMSGRKV